MKETDNDYQSPATMSTKYLVVTRYLVMNLVTADMVKTCRTGKLNISCYLC
jgi:hypothetical protein